MLPSAALTALTDRTNTSKGKGKKTKEAEKAGSAKDMSSDPSSATAVAPSERAHTSADEVDLTVDSADGADVGLVSNGSLSDTEVMDIMADEKAVEVEQELQHEREEREKAEEERKAKAPSLMSGALEQGRFAALNHLLLQSEAYAKFLESQMRDIEETMDQATEAGPSTQQGKAGGKRGRGDAGTAAAKRAKSSLTPTQRLLPLLKADLRDYQIRGVKWLISLYENGVNGILADQMGLGKTVQTLGFLSHLKSRGNNGPFMIVAPLSTLSNWVNEFERFLPGLPVVMYHGTKQEREKLRTERLIFKGSRAPDDYPAIVTSYEIVIADARALSKIKFKYVVVDEGHRLKNFNCRLLRELKTIPAENKLLLTGTPLQNNLSELWSLLNFLMPDVFRDVVDFEEWFNFAEAVGQEGADKAILAAEQRNKVVSKLHAILRPFMLRRLKSDVDIELPRKSEMILYAPMTDTQKQLNTQLKDGTLKDTMAALANRDGGNAAAVGKLNNVLMQMRKICNHPDLLTSQFTDDVNYPPPEVLIEQCGKMRMLDRLLKALHKRKHKVLIFSQMVRMLDVIESFVEQQGHKACRLDGSIPWQQRQENINNFNNDPDTWLFLLSTRAGGLGINLTAADTVIIYDSDWNPHQDLQAMDRCHRIGQNKPVLVFRLATSHSVEGRMLKRAADKMALERLVIRKGAFNDIGQEEEENTTKISLSASELVELLQGNYKMDDLPQSGMVTDKVLDKLLDRTHLCNDQPAPYPKSGVGYEVVQVSESKTILNNVNK